MVSASRLVEHRLVGQIKDGDEIKGYHLMNMETGRVVSGTEEEICKLIGEVGCENAIEGEPGKLYRTDDGLKRLPVYNTDGSIIGNPYVTVLKVFTIEGVKVELLLMDAYGRKLRVDHKKAIDIIGAQGAVNADIIKDSNGEDVIDIH